MPESPNGESRLDRIERLLEMQARDHAKTMADHAKTMADHAKTMADHAERMKDLDARMEILHVNIESLHANLNELYANTMKHSEQLARDGEHIRALARIAEAHERRLEDLEGGE